MPADAFELVSRLRRMAQPNVQIPDDTGTALMREACGEAADKIEMLQDWCRKLIEAGKFPGEIGNPLQ